MAFSTNQQIFEAIDKSKDILVAFKKDYSGDSIGGAIALLLFLRKMGKRVNVVCDGFTLPAGYTFLPQIKDIRSETDNLRKFIISLDISRTKVDEISYDVKENELDFIVSPKDGFFEESDITAKSSGFKYDLIFIIDTPDLERLGKIYDQDTEFFYKTPIINIDHSAANENFGQINLISLTAASTCEILFDVLSNYNEEMIDEDISTALLAGIIAATRNFKSNKVTPATLNAASRLITSGARRAEIVQNLYQARSLATLKLWGRVLARLKNDPQRRLTWSMVSKNDFSLTGAKEDNVDDVVEELIANSYEVETIIILYEDKEEEESSSSGPAAASNSIEKVQTNGKVRKVNVLITSLKNINSLMLAKNFPDAKGDDAKAKFSLTGLTLEQAEEKVIKEVKERLDELENKE
jgi:nanoRNase/pAp phosphatase (c-di-AMP/oligoRNAs hydrolase)